MEMEKSDFGDTRGELSLLFQEKSVSADSLNPNVRRQLAQRFNGVSGKEKPQILVNRDLLMRQAQNDLRFRQGNNLN